MVAANGGTTAAETDCDMPCPGSLTELCGGVERLSLYTWSTTSPLYVWNTPANTGYYEFLIGGIVIPLIATLGTNFRSLERIDELIYEQQSITRWFSSRSGELAHRTPLVLMSWTTRLQMISTLLGERCMSQQMSS